MLQQYNLRPAHTICHSGIGLYYVYEYILPIMVDSPVWQDLYIPVMCVSPGFLGDTHLRDILCCITCVRNYFLQIFKCYLLTLLRHFCCFIICFYFNTGVWRFLTHWNTKVTYQNDGTTFLWFNIKLLRQTQL